MLFEKFMKILGLSTRGDLDVLKSANRTLNEKNRKQEEVLEKHKKNEEYLQSQVEYLTSEVSRLVQKIGSPQVDDGTIELLQSAVSTLTREKDQLKNELAAKQAEEVHQKEIYSKIKESYVNGSGKKEKQKFDGRPPKPGVQKNIRFDYDVDLLLNDMASNFVFKKVDFVNETIRAALKKLVSEHEEYQEKYNSIILEAREIELKAIQKAEEERTKAKYDKLKEIDD